MAGVAVVLVACALAITGSNAVETRSIILNEDVLVGTCTGKCKTVPILDNKHGCTKISGCRFNSYGRIRGVVRCNFCVCECESDTSYKDVTVETTTLNTDEEALYGKCSGKCPKAGLVRTDFAGCQEVRNCSKRETGRISGVFRCDYCSCVCIKRKYSQRYLMKNVKYDLDKMNITKGQLTSLTETILENGSEESQTVTRSLTISHSRTTELSTAVGYGQTITIGASFGLGSLVGVTSSVSHQLTHGFEYTAGNTTTKEDQIQASIKVPPYSKMNATVFGRRLYVYIPYSADLITTYNDGSTSTKAVKGFYTNVDTGQFRVRYGAAQPLHGHGPPVNHHTTVPVDHDTTDGTIGSQGEAPKRDISAKYGQNNASNYLHPEPFAWFMLLFYVFV